MRKPPFHPLRFEPILQYRLWGGQRLPEFLGVAADGDGPFGEAWVLSDRPECASRVAEGPWKGATLPQLVNEFPQAMLGRLAGQFRRFPLLLKFLDVQKMLSVQVHPSDDQADLLPEGESGKTEAWVVLQAKPARIYAGLKPGVTADQLRTLSIQNADSCLPSFAPQPGDSVFIASGTVHSLGDGVTVFEIQENSDVTFRLYDWDHVDPRTGNKRPLQVEEALASIDYEQGAVEPVAASAGSGQRELVFDCSHFRLWRMRGASPFAVGAADEPRVLVCLEGEATVVHDKDSFAMHAGGVMLLPASVGVCTVRPDRPSNLLEIAIPDAA